VSQRSTSDARWRLALLVVGVIGLAVGGRSLAPHLEALAGGFHALGARGAVLFVAAFAAASAAFVPAGVLTMLAGALFGIPLGIVVAFAGASLGACMTFLLARYAARGLVERWLLGYPRVARLQEAVERDGRRIVALLRLSPVIPFSVINVAMGVTRMSFLDYLVANVAMLPVTALYVYYGAAAGALVAARGEHHPRDAAWWAAFVLGLAATIAVTPIVARLAARALAHEESAH
jgi:uncharacterized membrane protein YdjX (TVP38/TMEM64 family)